MTECHQTHHNYTTTPPIPRSETQHHQHKEHFIRFSRLGFHHSYNFIPGNVKGINWWWKEPTLDNLIARSLRYDCKLQGWFLLPKWWPLSVWWSGGLLLVLLPSLVWRVFSTQPDPTYLRVDWVRLNSWIWYIFKKN